MIHKTKNAVLPGTASEVDFTGLVKDLDYSHNDCKVHQIVQDERLSLRFGLPPIRADLIARFAYGGTYG